ncbi:DUF433 domain-containing protein [Pannus brasiliensis CCIBt3594]|uniref:DUF433 domain-containing protein n=1 Tax=Pannus brasiliensis CCIBt3594 TaxID=1427578 RepID=A0AAW9R0D5_9CHRO
MATVTDIGTLIVSDPEICGGRPRIKDSRITVRNIVIDIRSGMTPEEILENKPHLSLAKIYAALSYYYANQAEIDADISAYYEACKTLENESIAR